MNEFIDEIHCDTEELISLHPNSSSFLVFNLNRQDLVKFSFGNGLFQLVTESTRESHILDLRYTSRPNLFKCSVVKHTLTSDHRAIVPNKFLD